MDNDSTTTVASSRADIMKQIASQAASVRQNFETGKRKHSSIATAKAAEQMIARRRTAEEYQQSQSSGQTTTEQPWRMTSHIFHSHIASYTKTTPPPSSIPTSSSLAAHHHHHHQPPQQYPATSVAPRVSDGIILAASPNPITVTYNDVVCGKGTTTSALVGNQRYQVWIDLHREQFAKSFYEESRRNIAASIVNAVVGANPNGRFLSLDIHSGLWYDVGFDRAVSITYENLLAESGMMYSSSPKKTASVKRTFASKAA